MTSAAPVTPVPVASRRRQIWWWVLGLTVVPTLLFAAMVVSVLTLDRGAAALRGSLIGATDGRWETRCQLSVGAVTLGAVRQALSFINDPDIDKAQAALRTVRRASVGVYALSQPVEAGPRARAFADADLAMRRRGWTRVVGVTDKNDLVLIYTDAKAGGGSELNLCIGVISGKDLVVVSTRVDADELQQFIRQQMPDEFRTKLHLAKR
jgi:hypothetical protein